MADSTPADFDVFLSYARDDDAEFVTRLYAYLEEHGLRVWFDRESMSSRGNPFPIEIRDAIAAARRIALVIGPRALTSDFVANELQFALTEGKPITPLLRGRFPADQPFSQSRLPGRLRRLHTVDCQPPEEAPPDTETPHADPHALREIVRILKEQVGALGAYHHLGELPEWYVWRGNLLNGVVDAVRSSDPISVNSLDSATPGRPQPVAIQGMAGAGKTLLAQAVAREADVRRLFPDGIFWVEITRTPAIAARQAAIATVLSGLPETFADSERGRERLNVLLAGKKALFILDDVWDFENVRAFQMHAPGCQILLTTRLLSVAAHCRELSRLNPALRTEVLARSEALEMLALRLGISLGDVGEEPQHLVDLVEDLLGLHALAVSLAAAWLATRSRGDSKYVAQLTMEYLALLESHRESSNPFEELDLGRDERNPGLDLSLRASYETLSVELQRCFRELGVFAEARVIDIAGAAAVWAASDNLAWRHLEDLSQAALLSSPEPKLYRQHMLLRTYSRALLTRAPEELTAARERHYAYYLGRLRTGTPSEAEIDQALHALEGTPNKIELVEALIPFLSSSPFVWSGVEHGLLEALATLETAPARHANVASLVDRLARATEGQSNGLVVAALAKHCASPTAGAAVGWLESWLRAERGKDNGVAARTAARVAVLCRNEPLLERALTHPTESVRNVVIDDVHHLWRADTDLVERLLNFLTKQIRIHKLVNVQKLRIVVGAAVNFSVLLVLRDYADQPSPTVGVESSTSKTARPSVTLVQRAWRDVIRACLMVNSAPLLGPMARQVRRTLVGLLASITSSKLASIGRREYFTYSYLDMVAFFKSGDAPREAVDRLIGFIGGDEQHTLDGLIDVVYDLAARGVEDPTLTNWIITMVAQFALLSHMYRAPVAADTALYALLARLETLYAPTTDPKQPTAALWYLVATYPYLSFPYTDPATARSDAETALEHFMAVSLVGEFRFRNSWQCASGGDPLRVCNLEQYLFGYKLGIDRLGKKVLVNTLLFDIDKDDRSHIKWSPYSIAIGMQRYQAADEGIRAFEDMFAVFIEQHYFDRLSDTDLLRFWQKAADDLMLYASEYQHLFIELFKRFQEKELPDRLRSALQEAENRLRVNLGDQAGEGDGDQMADTQTGEAMAWALRNALYDKDPYFRDLLQGFLRGVARASSVEDAMAGLMQQVINGVYGEAVF